MRVEDRKQLQVALVRILDSGWSEMWTLTPFPDESVTRPKYDSLPKLICEIRELSASRSPLSRISELNCSVISEGSSPPRLTEETFFFNCITFPNT